MAKRKQAKSALPYIQRLLDDDVVQEQFRSAAGGLRTAYLRARAQRGQAVEDKKLYGSLRKAAVSIRNATQALQRPEPTPKRRTRKLATIALAMGSAGWLTTKLQRLEAQRRSRTAPTAESQPSATPTDASRPASKPERDPSPATS
jgi:hypothetical protein